MLQMNMTLIRVHLALIKLWTPRQYENCSNTEYEALYTVHLLAQW